MENNLYKLIRTILLFYVHRLDCLRDQSLGPYYVMFVFLVCQLLSIIANVFDAQMTLQSTGIIK